MGVAEEHNAHRESESRFRVWSALREEEISIARTMEQHEDVGESRWMWEHIAVISSHSVVKVRKPRSSSERKYVFSERAVSHVVMLAGALHYHKRCLAPRHARTPRMARRMNIEHYVGKSPRWSSTYGYRRQTRGRCRYTGCRSTPHSMFGHARKKRRTSKIIPTNSLSSFACSFFDVGVFFLPNRFTEVCLTAAIRYMTKRKTKKPLNIDRSIERVNFVRIESFLFSHASNER